MNRGSIYINDILRVRVARFISSVCFLHDRQTSAGRSGTGEILSHEPKAREANA